MVAVLGIGTNLKKRKNMTNEQLTSLIVQYLKGGYYEYEIKELLKEKNIAEDDFKISFEKAGELVYRDKLKMLEKRNKLFFALFITLLIVTFIVFFFVLPIQIESPSTFLSILGAAVMCVFSYLSIAYYKSWELEFIKNHETPRINFGFLIIMLLPGLLVYFLFSYRFENVADAMLKENQIEVVGKVVSGGETEINNRRGSIKISTIVIEFLTKEGQKIIAYEDVDSYEFKGFHLNQEVTLIYSKTNPKNISLLMSDSDISAFKGSKERDIQPKDLIYLMSVDRENILTSLNQISYGWEFNEQEALWVNNRKNIGISVSENVVVYIAHNFNTADYFLEKNGFKRVDKENSGGLSRFDRTKVYEYENYNATIEAVPQANGEAPLAVTTIRKK